MSLNHYKWPVALFLYFASGYAYAIDIQTVLTNVSSIIQPLTALALMISFIAGIFMIMQALMAMKKFGNMSTQQMQPGEIGGPFMKFVVGAILIYLPTSTDILMNSIFGSYNSIFGSGTVNYQANGQGSALLTYMQGSGGGIGGQWAAMANTLVLYIQFLGLLSFIKGWFIISKSAGHGAQPGNFGKGVTHIIGGIIAINFISVVNIIMNTVYGT